MHFSDEVVDKIILLFFLILSLSIFLYNINIIFEIISEKNCLEQKL